MKLDWSKIFLDAFSQPAVLKILIVGVLFVFVLIIFRALVDRAVDAYFRNHPHKKAKTSTLVIVGIFLVILLVTFWKAF